MPLANLDILTRRVENSARVVFVHPYGKDILRAFQALEIRGLAAFGKNPILIPDVLEYNAYYADIEELNAEAYAAYAMIVRDFYGEDLRKKFDILFDGMAVDKIPRSVHNPSNYMQANAKLVKHLIDKYRDTAPLEYYGTPFPAMGVALFLKSLESKDRKGAINNCDPGLGKTRQAIVAYLEAGFKTSLVIAPKSARAVAWPTEIPLVDKNLTWKFINKDNWREIGVANFDLLQWDELRRMPEEFFNHVFKFPILIVDEFHKASNYGSQRSVALEKIAKAIPHIWPLTGTVMRKRPRNLINILRLLEHPIVGSEEKIQAFLLRYCGYYSEEEHQGRGGWVDEANNLDELHELLRDSLFRWEKNQTNLPPKLRHIIEIPLSDSERVEYDGAWDEFKKIPERAKKMLNKNYPFGVVKQKIQHMAAARIKVPHLIEWAETRLEAGKKVAIYTDVTDVFDALMEHFGDICVGIDGRTSTEKRLAYVEKFQHDPNTTVFIGNLIAAGESITITAADQMALADINRVPSDVTQTEDRINRGGAVNTSDIYYFICLNTQDEKVMADFVQSNEVVRTVTARRDEFGNIHEPAWTGPIEKYRNWGKK